MVSAAGVAATVVFQRTMFPSSFLMGVFSRWPFRELQLPVRYRSLSLPAAFTSALTIVNWIFLLSASGYRLTDSCAAGAWTAGFYSAASISSSSSCAASFLPSSSLLARSGSSTSCWLVAGSSSSRLSSLSRATGCSVSSCCRRSERLLSLGRCSLVGASEPFSADWRGWNLTSQISLMSGMSLEREWALLSLSSLRRGTFWVTVPYFELTISSQISLNSCTLARTSSSQSAGSSQVVRRRKSGGGGSGSSISLTAQGLSLRVRRLRSCRQSGAWTRMSSAHSTSLREWRSLPSCRQSRALRMCASGLLSAYLMARCRSSSRLELRARRRCRQERLAQRLSKAGSGWPALNCSEKRLKQATQLRWLRLMASPRSCTAASMCPSCEWKSALLEQSAELWGDLAMHCVISSSPFSYSLSSKWLDAKRNSYSTYIDLLLSKPSAAKRIALASTTADALVGEEARQLQHRHRLGKLCAGRGNKAAECPGLFLLGQVCSMSRCCQKG